MRQPPDLEVVCRTLSVTVQKQEKDLAEADREIARLRAALEGSIEAMERGAGSLAEYANILSHEPHAADLLDAAIDRARAALEDK